MNEDKKQTNSEQRTANSVRCAREAGHPMLAAWQFHPSGSPSR